MADTEEYKGYVIRIEPDPDPQSPREDDNLGTMVCFHRRYRLGDAHDLRFEGCSWPHIERRLRTECDAAVVLPLWLYDHSGLRIKVGSFAGLLPQGHAEFDTMPVGYLYVSRAALRKEYGVTRITTRLLARATEVLQGEVRAYDRYLSGQYVGYVIEKDGTEVDSCWGIDDADYARREARQMVDARVQTAA